ncbi:hypothetical protein B7P43_G11201 [Cryptotermes secundus]|uniref:Uncharacterized protein n=1 Tax=Cryptotermes secundus TaxID=105785 RepID=A0A2J7QMB6_9NEOP|nr:hypothetical protein B7P43_G11201 [Cryptotermes secundus]
MDSDELFDDEVDEVADEESAGENNFVDTDDTSDEDMDMKGDEYSEGSQPIRDDSAYVFSLHKGSVFCCHLQPMTGKLAVTGAQDDVAYVWETHSGEVILHCKDHKIVSVLDCKGPNPEAESSNASVEAVGFCQDSSFSLAATGNLDGVLCIWDISRVTVRHTLKQDSGITKLLWIKNSPHFYTAGLDGTVRLYDARSGTLQNELFGHSHCILDISLSADCSTLLTSSDDSTARIFSVKAPDR